jgi:dihydrofolate reductase
MGGAPSQHSEQAKAIRIRTVTRDPTATIRELKEQSGKDIWLWGSLKLMHCLLDAGVVDEVRMLV